MMMRPRPSLLRHWPYFLLMTAAVAALTARPARDLWFDEALTLMNFALPLDAAGIYRAYVIPNNQIVHTLLLRAWSMAAPDGIAFDQYLRWLPLTGALALLTLLYVRFRVRVGGGAVLLPALTALAVSTPFAIYGSALRGYLWGGLFTVAALDGALSFARRGGWKAWAGFFLFSLLAVGTIPSNLAALAGAVLYAMPLCGPELWRRRRFWIMAGTPLLALTVFYLPISRQLLGCLRLGEGWRDGMAALAASGAALTVAAAMLLFPVLLGALLVFGRRRFNWTFSARAAIFLLPIPACLLLPTAPFPRVFFPLWPLSFLLFAGALKHLTAYRRRYRRRWSATLLLVALSVVAAGWGYGTAQPSFGIAFSRRFGGAAGDDYFAPYYWRENFRPRQTMERIRREAPDAPLIYSSFAADPWALGFYGRLFGIAPERLTFDGPRGRVAALPPGALVILSENEQPQAFADRFGRPLRHRFTVGRNVVYEQ